MPAQKRRSAVMTLLAVVGCLWFGLHAVEYVAGQYAPVADLVALPEGYGLAAMLNAVPAWVSGLIAATVWLGLLGSFLLLLQDRASVLVLSVALLSGVGTVIWAGLALAQGLAVLGGVQVVQFTLGLAAVTFGCWLYARMAKVNGAL
jgi:hypothetical protein